MHEVTVAPRPLAPLEPLLETGRYRELVEAAESTAAALSGRTLWCVSSTATGGGVAEMLQSLLGYVASTGTPARWLVLDAEGEFFTLTKRIHNRLHGAEGDGGPLGERERAVYAQALAGEGEALRATVAAGDLVLLHDPQTAGLVGAVLDAGAVPVWRCHIGLDDGDENTDQAWAFLRPDVERAAAVVLSRASYRQDWMPEATTAVIAPAIDPFATKNVHLDDAVVARVLARAGVLAAAPPAGEGDESPEEDESGDAVLVDVGQEEPVRVARSADVLREDGPLDPATPLVVQVSRWDRLKDMRGVLDAFAQRVATEVGRGVDGEHGVHLALVGPSVEGVSDDPEGAQVLADCQEAWRALAPEQRRRCSLVTLPMDDVHENALMVNALQRHAAVVVQKSLVEGFGLTVAEAMWKGRPVVASAVGGITDQVVDGESGRLVDPRDAGGFAGALLEVLGTATDDDGETRAGRLGTGARARVRERFLPDRQLLEWARLLERLA